MGSDMLTLVVVTLVYLLACMSLGFYGYAKTKTATDYLVAGRQVHPGIMALSYGATFISTSAIVGFGGAAAFFGMGLLWLTFLNIFLGIFIAFTVFGKRTRHIGHNLNAHTFPELLGRRFNSKFIQFFAGMIIFIFMPIYASAVLLGGAQFIKETFQIDLNLAIGLFALIVALYVVSGGMKAVMYTDAFQGALMLIGMTILIVYAYAGVGGVVASHRQLTNLPQVIEQNAAQQIEAFNKESNEKLTPDLVAQLGGLGKKLGAMKDEVKAAYLKNNPKDAEAAKDLARFKTFMGWIAKREEQSGKKLGIVSFLTKRGTAPTGLQGWTRMPARGSMFWYYMVTTVILGVGIGVLAQPQLSVRFMTVKSARELNRAIPIGGFFILMMTGVAFVVGALSNVYFYYQKVGEISFVVANQNTDAIIPIYLNSALPKWFVGVFMLTLLAAAMSTLSSQFHAMGTAIGRDIYEQSILGGERRGTTILITRIGMVVAIVLTVALTYRMGESIIPPATALFFGLCASSFLPMLFGALFFRGITKAGAIAGMCTGFFASMFWLCLVQMVKAKNPAILAPWLLGKDSLLAAPWRFIDALVIAFPLAAIVTIVVSLATRKMPDEHLDVCFRGIGKKT
jgi:SSS family solute:Na+ symporter